MATTSGARSRSRAEVRERTLTAPTAPKRVEMVSAWFSVAWCLLFAAANVYELTMGFSPHAAEHATGLRIMGVVAIGLKMAGAGIALSIAYDWGGRAYVALRRTLVWGAFSTLAVYSIGNVAITVTTTAGLVAPSVAWTKAGGVTPRAVAYVAFFVAGAAAYGVLAISHLRRTGARWVTIVPGMVGALALLWLLLIGVPMLLSVAKLLPDG